MAGRLRQTGDAGPKQNGLTRMLTRLAAEGATLRETEDGWVCATASGTPSRIPDRLVGELRSRDLVETAPGTNGQLRLSGNGRALLRRLVAREEPFRAQHRIPASGALSEPDAGTATVNAGESPLGWLARRKGPDGRAFLTGAEVAAGEKLRTDFTLAHLSPKVTQSWNQAPGRGDWRPETIQDAQLAARQRFHAALDAAGPVLADVLVAVCCHLQGMEEAEREFGWPVRSGKVVLKIALERLARHYRLAPDAAPRPSRSWHADS